MPAPRPIDPFSVSVKDQQFEKVLNAAHNSSKRRPVINQAPAQAGNPLAEDSFERARKAFFETGKTKPDTERVSE